MIYFIRHIDTPSDNPPRHDDPLWHRTSAARLAQFHPRSSSHRPETEARLLCDGATFYLRFHVRDRYIRSIRTRFMDPVSLDSCVEWFVMPGLAGPYFNFEINAGGTLLASCIRDPRRTPGGFADWAPLDAHVAGTIRVSSTLPPVVEPAVAGPLDWTVTAAIPLAALESHVGPLSTASGTRWRGNFYKCGDDTPRPHWASWSPIGAELNFHQPDCFAVLEFADSPRCTAPVSRGE